MSKITTFITSNRKNKQGDKTIVIDLKKTQNVGILKTLAMLTYLNDHLDIIIEIISITIAAGTAHLHFSKHNSFQMNTVVVII